MTITERDMNLESLDWGGMLWINIEKPTEIETQFLSQHYPFHPMDLDDCLSRIQRPKVDVYDEYLFFVFHFPVYSKEAQVTQSSQVSVFIGDSYLITLHSGELKPLSKLFRDCQINEKARKENMNNGSGYLLYRIVDRLVDYCLPILNKVQENIEKVEDDIFDEKVRETVQEVSILRRDIISFRRIIWPMRAVIGGLERRVKRYIREDMQEEMEVYFGDLVDHVDRIWDGLDEFKQVIEGLDDTNNSLSSYQINEVMRVLTIMATILMPITLVASIFGMNVPLPGGSEEGSITTFFYMLLLMLCIAGGMLYFFRRRHWL